LFLKLLGHFIGYNSSNTGPAKIIRPFGLNLTNFVDVMSCHVLNPGERFLNPIQSP
jgi:hypothetical protein